MALVTPDEVVSRLDPQPDPSTHGRIEILIGDAEFEVADAFAERGRDFDQYLAVDWQSRRAARVVREMVSAAIIIGPNAGVRSASSTTGPQSDSIVYADVDSVSFAGVLLTDKQRKALGLGGEGLPRGTFPPPRKWPEVIHRGRDYLFPGRGRA